MKPNFKKPIVTAAISVACLFANMTCAHAATVLIDWSTAAVVTNPAGDGKYWNSLGAAGSGSAFNLATTALVDQTNAATGWSVAVSHPNTSTGFGGTGINGPAGADPFDESNAVIDGIFANELSRGVATITFTGLASLTQYDFSAIGGRAASGTNGLITILSGTSGSSTYNLLNNGTIANFSVTSTVGGEISFTFGEAVADGGTTSATFNALRMTQIPEPSVALLGAVGILGLLRRRR